MFRRTERGGPGNRRMAAAIMAPLLLLAGIGTARAGTFCDMAGSMAASEKGYARLQALCEEERSAPPEPKESAALAAEAENHFAQLRLRHAQQQAKRQNSSAGRPPE